MRKKYSKMIVNKSWEAKVKFSFTVFTVGEKFEKKDFGKKALPSYQIRNVAYFAELWKYVICFQKELSNLG